MPNDYVKPGVKSEHQFSGPGNSSFKERLAPLSVLVESTAPVISDIAVADPLTSLGKNVLAWHQAEHPRWSYWQCYHSMSTNWGLYTARNLAYEGEWLNGVVGGTWVPYYPGAPWAGYTNEFLNGITFRRDASSLATLQQIKRDGYDLMFQGGGPTQSQGTANLGDFYEMMHKEARIIMPYNHWGNGCSYVDIECNPPQGWVPPQLNGCGQPYNIGYGDWPWNIHIGDGTYMSTRYGPNVAPIINQGVLIYGYDQQNPEAYFQFQYTTYGPTIEFGDNGCYIGGPQSWVCSMPTAKWTWIWERYPHANVYDMRQIARQMTANWRKAGNNGFAWDMHQCGYGVMMVHTQYKDNPNCNEEKNQWNHEPWDERWPTQIGVGSPLAIGVRISPARDSVNLVWYNFWQTGFDHTEVWLNDTDLIYAGLGYPAPAPDYGPMGGTLGYGFANSFGNTSINGITWKPPIGGNMTLHLYTVTKDRRRSLPERYTIVPLTNMVANSSPGFVGT